MQEGGPSGRAVALGVIHIEDELIELGRVMTGSRRGILLETEVLHYVLILAHLILHLFPDLLLLLVLLCTVQHVLQLGSVGDNHLSEMRSLAFVLKGLVLLRL